MPVTSLHPGAAVSPSRMRHALSHFATGVTIVTSLSPEGEPVGMTASAVSSLSLDPPLLLVCLERASHTLAAIREHGAFAVNVLAEDQQPLSSHFARRGPAVSWETVAHRRGASGSPRLDGVLAVLECRLEEGHDGGDHAIVIGRLHELEVGTEGLAPLLHYRGVYAALQTA